MRCAASATSRGLAFVALAGLLAACGNSQRPSTFAPVCPKYDTQVQPLLDARCKACHSPGGQAEAYQVSDYLHAVRPSDDDVARVVGGDNDSLLLKAARGENVASFQHVKLDDAELTTLTTWVVECKGAPDPTQYHPTGWASPIDPQDFHGAYLRDAGYVLIECQSCHGQDLRGGKAKVDCNSCHAKGPLSCNTCHGDETSNAPPKALNGSRSRTTLGVGAHRQHVNDGPLHLGFKCTECHPNITNAEDEGHYRFGMKFVSTQPVVTLKSVVDPDFPDAGPATWDRTTATCTNGACHAPEQDDTAATAMVAKWTSTDGANAKCGSCHGVPPSDHFYDQHCEGCHTAGYANYADGGVDLVAHVNGQIDLGPGTDCDVCHSGPGKLPWRDTNGDIDAGSPSVGAHTAHLQAGTLRGPLGCADCHKVPSKTVEMGHVDTARPAEVFDSTWLGGLAALDGAQPTFNASNGTCGSVYCHGGGNLLVSTDLTPNLNRNPKWNGGKPEAACGSCHGTPPQDGQPRHQGITTVQQCSQCHGLAVNPDGTIRFFTQPDGGMTSFHMDGVVNGNN